MDEPLSNLDAKLRVGMRASLAQLHQRLGVTTVYVTHDQVEAMTLGQRVAVMRDGRILQVDAPQTLYEQPARPLRRGLHRLAGDEPRRGDASRATRSRSGSSAIPLDPARRPGRSTAAASILGIRPETFEDAAFAPPELPTIDVEVVVLEELGSDAHVVLPRRRDARSPPRRSREDDDDDVDLVTDRGSLLNARVDPRTTARVGELAARSRSTRRASTSSTPRRARRSSRPTRRRAPSRAASVAR